MSDTYCRIHPGQKSVTVCPRCQAYMCNECVRLGNLCPICREELGVATTMEWIKPGQKAIFGLLWDTWKNLAIHPIRTGRLIGSYPRLGRAWLFALVTVGLVILVNLIFTGYQLISAAAGIPDAFLAILINIAILLGMLLGSSLATILILSILLSLGQVLIGNRFNFRMTMAVSLYAQIAALLNLVPCFGGMIVPIVTLLMAGLLIKGMSGESNLRASLAVIIPLLFLLGSLAIMIFVIWQQVGEIILETNKAMPLVNYQLN